MSAKSLESLRIGRDGYKRELKLLVKTDRISAHGRFIDGGEIRRSRPIAPKEPEIRSAPSSEENIPGTGIVYALIFAILFWLGVAFFCLEANAENYHVVHARGYLSASNQEAKEIYAVTQAIWQRETGRELKIRSWQSRRNPFQRFHISLGGRATVLWLWEQFAIRKKLKGGLVALVPPFHQGGLYYIAGMAVRCGKVAMATVEPINQLGEDRRIHSSIVVAHELGHLSGAAHDDSEPIGIMNSNVAPYSSLELHFSERSKNEMRCGR